MIKDLVVNTMYSPLKSTTLQTNAKASCSCSSFQCVYFERHTEFSRSEFLDIIFVMDQRIYGQYLTLEMHSAWEAIWD